MNLTPKVSSLQSYNLTLHRGALHPEFFDIEGRRKVSHGDYEFEAWIYRGGHVLRFEHNGICLTESVGDSVDRLPDRGIVTTLPCAGERDHEADFADRITYMTSIQTETLSGHLYLGTYSEMLEHGQTPECLMVDWETESERNNLSVIDVQRFCDEVHVQAYHLRNDCGLVLRTQTIFQLKQPD